MFIRIVYRIGKDVSIEEDPRIPTVGLLIDLDAESLVEYGDIVRVQRGDSELALRISAVHIEKHPARFFRTVHGDHLKCGFAHRIRFDDELLECRSEPVATLAYAIFFVGYLETHVIIPF